MKRWMVICEMMRKNIKLKKEHKTRNPCHIIMYGKIISMRGKLCHDQKTRGWESVN